MPDTEPTEQVDDTDDPIDEQSDDAPIEAEVEGLLDACADDLRTLESRANLPRGVKEIFKALQSITTRLAEEVAYKADVDDLETVVQAAQQSAAQQPPADMQAALGTLTQVVQLWSSWAPALVGSGDAGLIRFVGEMGAALEAHTRASLPIAGFTPQQIDEMVKATAPFVPQQGMTVAPMSTQGGNGVVPQPVAG